MVTQHRLIVEQVSFLLLILLERGECEPHRMDDAFLLRFLRARHFIVRMAHRLVRKLCMFPGRLNIAFLDGELLRV